MATPRAQVTLDHLYRDQLVAMARFLNMNAFAPTCAAQRLQP